MLLLLCYFIYLFIYLFIFGYFLSQECEGMREEMQKLRRENSSLDSSSHEQDKMVTQLKTRLAILEQELQDKEQVSQAD